MENSEASKIDWGSLSALSPIGEVEVDTNYDERMTMLVLANTVPDFIQNTFELFKLDPAKDLDDNQTWGVRLMVGMSNTLGYRLNKMSHDQNPMAATLMIGEVLILMLALEHPELSHEAIHERYNACLPEHLTDSLREKMSDTVRRMLTGDCYVRIPEDEGDSLFTKTVLEMMPTQGGLH